MIWKKKSFFLLVVLIAPLDMSIVKANEIDHNDIECFLDAIAEVETENNPHAIGDKGLAIGLYQIHRAYWQDGTRILGVDWDYEYAFDPKKSRKVVKAYLLHYGKGKSFVDMARIHNGGPKGCKKKSTLSYARKVEMLLQAKTQMPHPEHDKHLCYLNNPGFQISSAKEYKVLVKNSEYLRKVCGRVAARENNFCKPLKL